MKYREGYVNQLAEGERFQTELHPAEDIHTEFIHLSRKGELYGEAGYAWDGPSGPIKYIAEKLGRIPYIGKRLKAAYLKTILTPSLAHDMGYQLMRMKLLPPACRDYFDKLLVKECDIRGMTKIRQRLVYIGVSKGAGYAADPANAKKVIEVV